MKVALPTPRLRRTVDESLPFQPRMASKYPPEISVVIPAEAKDFSLLRKTIASAESFSLNPIREVLVIVPKSQEKLARQFSDTAQIEIEEAFLPGEIRSAISGHFSPHRRGWATQQVLKLWAVWTSTSPGVLCIDSDTIFTRPRQFLDSSGRQLISFSREYHPPYEAHAERIWGSRRTNINLSFVTHFQLMQPGLVREMFSGVDDVVRWLTESDPCEMSSLSEYHCYGRWISDNRPNLVRFGKWGNVARKLDPDNRDDPVLVESILANVPPDVGSVSFHSYMDKESERIAG